MIGKPEVFKNIPLLDELEKTLKERGDVNRKISASELKAVMNEVVSGLLAKNEGMTVKIGMPEVSNSVASIGASIEVTKPIKATIIIKLSLGNSGQVNQAMLNDLSVDIQAGFVQKRLVQAYDIEGTIRQVLSNPNAALYKVLSEKLSANGVRLNPNLGLNFSGSQITLILSNDAFRREAAKPAELHRTDGPVPRADEPLAFELMEEPGERVYETEDTQPTRKLRPNLDLFSLEEEPDEEEWSLKDFESETEPEQPEEVVIIEEEKPAKPALRRNRFARK